MTTKIQKALDGFPEPHWTDDIFGVFGTPVFRRVWKMCQPLASCQLEQQFQMTWRDVKPVIKTHNGTWCCHAHRDIIVGGVAWNCITKGPWKIGLYWWYWFQIWIKMYIVHFWLGCKKKGGLQTLLTNRVNSFVPRPCAHVDVVALSAKCLHQMHILWL